MRNRIDAIAQRDLHGTLSLIDISPNVLSSLSETALLPSKDCHYLLQQRLQQPPIVPVRQSGWEIDQSTYPYESYSAWQLEGRVV